MTPLAHNSPDPMSTVCRILIADDEPKILDAYRAALEHAAAGADGSAMRDLEAELFGDDEAEVSDRPQYDLCFCRQGEEAIAAVEQAVAESRPFAVAFLDVRMPPGIDGITAAERLRAVDPNMHIVFVTGYSDVAPEDIAARVSMPEMLLFCQKPLHTSELRQLAYSLSSKWLLDRELRTALMRLRQLMDSATVVIYSAALSGDHSLTYVSDNAARLFGDEAATLIGRDGFWADYVHQEDREFVLQQLQRARDEDTTIQCEYRVLGRDGALRWVSDRISVARDSNNRPRELVGCWLDITERRSAEDRVIDLAYFDSLTGLPNRALMKDLLERAIGAAEHRERKLALLFLDLDSFKQINDMFGHDTGDRVLKEVGNRLTFSIRQCDRLCRPKDLDAFLSQNFCESVIRLGGDEFVVILPETTGPAGAAQVAQRIISAFNEPMLIDGDEIYIRASIGISIFPDDASDLTLLLKHADMAMYQAKAEGRNRYAFYTSEIKERATRRFSIDLKLRKALENDEFELFYQPRINLKGGNALGAEGLLRWRHPEDGLIAPGEFIPIIEENGQIIPIGERVLKDACTRAVSWAQSGLKDLAVSVNLSTVQLGQSDFPQKVAAILAETGLAPHRLELELTESMLMEDSQRSCSVLAQLKEIGVRLSVDDFGTGYSSLSYLKRFPLDALKIDRSFIGSLPADDHDAAIVSATIALAHKLGLSVVAEGVETEAQLHFLLEHGCEEAQGFLFSRPVDATAFEQWIRAAEQRRHVTKQLSFVAA